VPKILADDGFDSEVVTRRLRDAIRAIQQGAHTRMRTTPVEFNQEDEPISIPKLGVSVDSIAAWVSDFFLPRDWQHKVSGEFTLLDKQLSLRLRLNGQIIPSDPTDRVNAISGTVRDLSGTYGVGEVDRLIDQGAFNVVRKTQPFVVAAHLFVKGDLEKAANTLDWIIASFPPEDQNVIYAHNLKGIIAEAQQNLHNAAFEYQTAIQHDPRFALAHTNLAMLWYNLSISGVTADASRRLRDDAFSELQKAIQVDPTIAAPHVGLGVAWGYLNKPYDALLEFQKAIQLDPTDAAPHDGLGNVWADLSRFDDALLEFQKAMRLEPTDAVAHDGLGRVWAELNKLDDALSEFQKAMRLNPADRLAIGLTNGVHRILAIELVLAARAASSAREMQSDLHEACSEFLQGPKHVPTDLSASDALRVGQSCSGK
jgi:tetratricopeptide (TPR) repeat protein